MEESALSVPPEPSAESFESNPMEMPASWIVLEGVPRYLWEYWKNSLGAKGIQWEQFRLVIKNMRDDIWDWHTSERSWEFVVETCKSMLDKHLSKSKPVA